MKNKKNAVGLATQIVFEYSDWGDEHISDMMATFELSSKAPCSGYELQDLCSAAQKLKSSGLDCDAVTKELLKKKKT